VLRAVIFDLDGVLVDSEQLWRDAEIAVFGALGVPLDDDRCRETTGLRVDEVVEHWYERYPWPAAAGTAPAVADALVGEMAQAMRAAPVVPGAVEMVRFCAGQGVRLAVASSSPEELITAALDRLGLAPLIETCHSAMDEEYGKPHPAVYLTAAAKLGVPPLDCVAVEDSLNGVISAKAARMRCVAIPDRPAPAFAVADVVLPDLNAFGASVWHELEALCAS
jgi:sugar-phosphatase